MDEAACSKHAGFDTLKRDLDAFADALSNWVRAQLNAKGGRP
jgi:N-formylglutamate deformylase